MKLRIIMCVMLLWPINMSSQEINLVSVYGSAINFMDLVISVTKENDKKKIDSFTYSATHVVKRVDDYGRVLRNNEGNLDEVTEIIVISGNDGKLEKKVILRNGKKTEDSRPSGFPAETSQVFAARYDYSFAFDRPLQIGNGEYVIINFKPKVGLMTTSKEDHVLNRSEGKIFVNSKNLLVWKVEARLPDEFTVLTWFKVFSANLMFEQQEIDGIAVEKVITIAARYRNGWGMFVNPKNLDEVYTFHDYIRIK